MSNATDRPAVDAGRLATAGVDLVIGLAVLSLLRSVMRRTTRIVPGRGHPR